MYDIIIVGAGPAGLTSAIYARRANKKVLVLEATTYGGQIINTLDIANYPVEPHISGFDFATKLFNQVKDLGAEFVFEKVIDIIDNGKSKEVVTTKGKYEGKAIILATGNDNRKLGLDNEDGLLGKGVSYCATCDGAFYKGKTVAVVGGGNTALEDALYLSDIANKVYLIHRRNEFRAEEASVDDLKEKDNVEIICNSNVTKLVEDGKLKAIEVTNNDGSVNTIDVDGLFIAVGRIPENQNFAKLIKLDEAGYVEANEDCHTNVAGIFVAGDNRVKLLRQLVTATGDGAVAATEAIKYVNILIRGEKNDV
ncbi:MAG: FAD-dependent oxidoreductase [Bacilli bacterium]|nr:FAD-dependent oxidoreductase [Bacilli bacterium]